MADTERSTPAHTISVNLWGSHPDESNDDCWIGIDFPSVEAARAWCADPKPLVEVPAAPGPERDGAMNRFFSFAGELANTAYLQIVRDADENGLDGEEIAVVRHEAFFTPKATRRREREAQRERDEEQREHAMQAGMAFGCDGYNDAMGW